MGNVRGNKGEWAWHVHHEQLYEKLTEPLQNRVNYVKGNKFDDPTLRLKLMRVVEDQKELTKLVDQLTGVLDDHNKAMDRVNQLSASRKSKQADIDQANEYAGETFRNVVKIEEAIMDLHRKECEPDCPWNGVSILSGKVAATV